MRKVVFLVVVAVAVIGASVLVGFIGSREPQKFDWELAATVLTGLGTTALAVVTGALAWATSQDVRAAQRTAAAAEESLKLTRSERDRRPRLSLEADTGLLHSQVEGDGLPYVRLLVRNEPGLRAAHGTRVLVDHYRRPDGSVVTFGSPSLGWTSAGSPDESVVVFSGAARVIDLGKLLPVTAIPAREVSAQIWELEIFLPLVGQLRDHRERVRPGTEVRLVVGADEADARFYDVLLGWQMGATSAQHALTSLATRIQEVSSLP